MTIYVDLLFFLNFFFDFNLLLTVNNTLKRYVKLRRIFIASLIGSLTTFTLFLSFDTFWLFVLKIVLGAIMCAIAFGMKDRVYFLSNLIYFFMTSMVLGGGLYFFLLTFGESHVGLAFSYHELSYSILFMILFSPLMLFIYQRQRVELKKKERILRVKICLLNHQVLDLVGYLDTGNCLRDPITKKKIVLVDTKKIPRQVLNHPYYVPYHSLNHQGLLSCIKINYLEIKNHKSYDFLVGVSNGKLFQDGISCVLNESCLEEMI